MSNYEISMKILSTDTSVIVSYIRPSTHTNEKTQINDSNMILFEKQTRMIALHTTKTRLR